MKSRAICASCNNRARTKDFFFAGFAQNRYKSFSRVRVLYMPRVKTLKTTIIPSSRFSSSSVFPLSLPLPRNAKQPRKVLTSSGSERQKRLVNVIDEVFDSTIIAIIVIRNDDLNFPVDKRLDRIATPFRLAVLFHFLFKILLVKGF